MKITISEATLLSKRALVKSGFKEKEAAVMVDNFIEAELSGKTSHGLSKILWLVSNIDKFRIALDGDDVETIRETPVSLLIDGKKKTGFYVLNEAMGQGIKMAKKSGMVAGGLTNTSATTGFMGQYARRATDAELITIIFTGSPSRIVPYGTRQKLWGTNPITVGIPTGSHPLILDMATSKITFGDLMNAFHGKKILDKNVAIDSGGNVTTDPTKALEGGLLPISGYKGSGMAFVVEILAGALTSSMMGQTVKGGWGTFFLLIDPDIIRDKVDFYQDLQQSIAELKSLPKAKNNDDEIYYPGERSAIYRENTIKSGSIEVDDNVIKKLKDIIGHNL